MPDAAQPPAQPELPSPYQRGKRRGRARRTHTVAKVLLATLLTLGMVSGLSVAFLYRHLNGNLNLRERRQPAGGGPSGEGRVEVYKEPVNILVMGSDSDGCGSMARPAAARTPRSSPPLRGPQSAYGVSIPRDSLVDRPECKTADGDTIPGGSDAMWNAAYSYAAPRAPSSSSSRTPGSRSTTTWSSTLGRSLPPEPPKSTTT